MRYSVSLLKYKENGVDNQQNIIEYKRFYPLLTSN